MIATVLLIVLMVVAVVTTELCMRCSGQSDAGLGAAGGPGLDTAGGPGLGTSSGAGKSVPSGSEGKESVESPTEIAGD